MSSIPANAEKLPSTLLRWRTNDSSFGITKETAVRAAKLLGITETQLIHRALAEFITREVPKYDPNFEELTDEHYAAIRGLVPQNARQQGSKLIGSFLDA